MNNQYRIKIEIKLKYQNKGINNDNYILVIKVLKKDNRFNIQPDLSGNFEYSALTFIGSNDFSIITNNKDFKGSLESDSFNIPHKKYLNRNIEKSFITDRFRKLYLERLHESLIEWSLKWGSYPNEAKPKFKTIGNKWYIYI